MRVAFSHWKGRLSPVFDVSDRILLIDIEHGGEKMRQDILLTCRDPLYRAKEISDLGADILVCGAVSQIMETALERAGVQVTAFMCGDLQSVIAAFMCGELNGTRFRMPGNRRKRGSAASNPGGRTRKPSAVRNCGGNSISHSR